MRLLPIWAKKPKSKKTVIATPKGWVVKDTGEVLVSNKGLDEKLKALYKEIESVSSDKADIVVEEDVAVVEQAKVEEEISKLGDDTKEEEPEQQPKEPVDLDKKKELNKPEEAPKVTQEKPRKRRGRPPKNKNANTNSTN